MKEKRRVLDTKIGAEMVKPFEDREVWKSGSRSGPREARERNMFHVGGKRRENGLDPRECKRVARILAAVMMVSVPDDAVALHDKRHVVCGTHIRRPLP